MGESIPVNGISPDYVAYHNYCFGCLCHIKENQIKSYSFHTDPLKELLQMESIFLCYLCRRIAQHTELFIQNVQNNKILMKSFSNVMDVKLKSLQLQTRPLVNLKQVSYDVIELTEQNSGSIEETFCVVSTRQERVDVEIKIEIKQETDLSETSEAEFMNEDDEFSGKNMKEDDDLPLSSIVKEELEIETVDKQLINMPKNLKKNNKKAPKRSSTEIPEIKIEYISTMQCMEERNILSKDPKYLESVYKCTDCVKGFTFKASYDTHMEKHDQSVGDVECKICKLRMESKDKLDRHLRYHLIRYKCPECGINRSCRRTIKEHYVTCHLRTNQKYTCQQCMKDFKRPSSLRKHVAARTCLGGAERVTCAYCVRTCVDKAVLKSHMMLKHAKEVSAVEASNRCICPACGMGFKTPSQLRNHSTKHLERREHYCVECDKSFKTEAALKKHLKTVSTHVKNRELPFSCLHCEKCFSNRRDVDGHMNRMHLNNKPFTCDQCDKAFVNLWTLNKHKRYTHDGYKRPLQYQCPMCDKAFRLNQILKAHIRTHTGERPYQCSKCPAQFSQANILKTHDRLIHLKLTRDGKPKMDALK